MRMNDDELVRAVEAFEEDSLGFDSGDLASYREEALKVFVGDTVISAPEGRSSVNSTSLRDTYLWIAPQLLRTFLGSDEIVRFDPVSREDEQAAQQETEVIRWVMDRSSPFIQLNAMMQDALLLGTGYAKVWWHSDESVQVERYEGKSGDELAYLMNDAEVEVIEHSEYPDPEFVPPPPQPHMAQTPMGPRPVTGPDGMPVMMPVPQAPMLHDVVVRRRAVDEYARFEAVPPEEVRVHNKARSVSLQGVEFVEHRKRMTVSELREMGYDVPDEISSWYDDDDFGAVASVRDRWSEDQYEDDDEIDPASRRVTYREAYCLLDANRDGKAERIKVCIVGRKVLRSEEVDLVPFAAISPILFAHRHIGLSLYDLMKELEAIRTTLTRSYLDGLYLSLNQRTAIDANAVNIDDLLVSRPGGIVRTNGTPGDKLMPLPVLPIGDVALQGMTLLDSWAEQATGVSRTYQGGPGLDSKGLNNVNVGTISQAISQAQMRIEAIARSFADTGIKDLFLLLHQLTLKHARKAMTVKLRNQWTSVDPRTWRKRNVVSVQVALGAGTKEMRAQQLQQMIGLQLQLAPTGCVTPQNLYSSFARLCNELGYKNADEFVSNPQMMPPKPPPVDPLVQAQTIKSQSDIQIEQARLQAKAQDDQRKAALEQQSASLSVQQKQAEAQTQAELERFKAQTTAETQIAVARMKAEIEAATALQIEQMKLQGQGISNDTSASIQAHQGAVQQMMDAVQNLTQMMAMMHQEHQRRANAKVVRDARGKVAGTVDAEGNPIALVERDQTGRVAGVRPPIQ